MVYRVAAQHALVYERIAKGPRRAWDLSYRSIRTDERMEIAEFRRQTGIHLHLQCMNRHLSIRVRIAARLIYPRYRTEWADLLSYAVTTGGM